MAQDTCKCGDTACTCANKHIIDGDKPVEFKDIKDGDNVGRLPRNYKYQPDAVMALEPHKVFKARAGTHLDEGWYAKAEEIIKGYKAYVAASEDEDVKFYTQAFSKRQDADGYWGVRMGYVKETRHPYLKEGRTQGSESQNFLAYHAEANQLLVSKHYDEPSAKMAVEAYSKLI